MLVCDKCGEHVPDGANFCPRCADPVTEADMVTGELRRQTGTAIVIQFGRSSSGRFADAVALAQRLPTYDELEGGFHQVTLNGEDVALARSLWELVGNWKTSRMTLNGERATKKDLTYGALGCFQKRQQAFKPSEYCFGENEYEQNMWGCHRLAMPLNAWGTSWLCWGKYDSEGRWHWDRKRISHELEKGLHENRFCPALDPAACRAVLNGLPDRIHPPSSKGWNFVKEWQGNREVAVGVTPTLATAKRLAAKTGEPAWRQNESLARATSKLDRFDDYVSVNIATENSSKHAESGCLGASLLLIALPVALVVTATVALVT